MVKALPFGLCTALKLFSAAADGLAGALQCMDVVYSIHYLDDFLFCGPPDSLIFEASLRIATFQFARLGLSTAPGKTVSSTTKLTFLRIEINSVSQQLRLPSDKLSL